MINLLLLDWIEKKYIFSNRALAIAYHIYENDLKTVLIAANVTWGI